jgi:hypothetical protein
MGFLYDRHARAWPGHLWPRILLHKIPGASPGLTAFFSSLAQILQALDPLRDGGMRGK